MKNGYKITIALLTYNRCDSGYLKQSLDAILAQTFKDFELLVVDNHSTDGTPEFLRGYHDPRMTYIRQPPGGNATTSYIRSALMSRGEYIIMAHDDDIMEPTMIERHVGLIEKHPDLLVVSNNVSLIDTSGNPIQPSLYDLDEDLIFDKADYIGKYLEEKLWLPAPTLLFKRDNYVKAVSKWLGIKDQSYLASGDIWILSTLNLQGPIALIADPLLRYRQHSGQESRNVDQGFPMVEATRLLLKNHGRKKALKPHLPGIHAFLTRFRAQEACFKSESRPQLVKELKKLKTQWEKSVVPENRALDTILPFEISLILFGLEPTVPAGAFHALVQTPAKGGGRRGFRDWLKKLRNRENLFEPIKGFKRIAIVGSMLNAYLLAISARMQGTHVECCYDSSPARIDKKVLDIPVVPMDTLADTFNKIDAIILSSEHDQEDALKLILKDHLRNKPSIPIISWKELANGGVKAFQANG